MLKVFNPSSLFHFRVMGTKAHTIFNTLQCMQLLTLNVKRSTAHPEEILDKYWTKAVDYGAARLEKKRKTAEKIHG